jgi:hypothetical protein
MALSPVRLLDNGVYSAKYPVNWTLGTFPSEVVGSIAEYAGIRGVANLWCCGCPLLNQKLSSPDGIQQIVINDRMFTLGDWFPTDLRLLGGVKSISAHFRSACHPLIATLIRPGKLASLRHLESIDFSFEEALTCWKGENQSNQKHSAFNFKRDLPSLTSLQLTLPSVRLAIRQGGLYRDSSLEQGTEFVTSHIAELPSSLTRLSLDFPFDLTSLKLRELSFLPTTLEDVLLANQKLNLAFAFKLPFLKRLSLPRLMAATFEPKEYPPHVMQELSMPACTQISLPSSQNSFTGDALFQCLSNLQTLEVYWTTSVDWRSMPYWARLKQLKLHGRDELFSPFVSTEIGSAYSQFGSGFFPPTLLVLDMRHVIPSRASWLAFLRNFVAPPESSSFGFPASLSELYLPKIEIAPSTAAKLPRQLVTLGLCWTGGAEHLLCKTLSSDLRILQAYVNHNQASHTSTFSFCEKHLPTTLRKFIDGQVVYTNVNGSFFDPALAARYNKPQALDYLLQHGCPSTIDSVYDVRTLWTAVRYGSMAVLHWVENQTPELLFAYRCADAQPYRHRADNLQSLMKAAVLHQQLGALQWLHRLGFAFPTRSSMSAKPKNMPMLMSDPDGYKDDASIFPESLYNLPLAIAIEKDNVEFCAYLLEKFPMDTIWKKRRKIKQRQIVPIPKGRKRTSSASSSGSNRSNRSDGAISDHSDDDYDFVEVISEEALQLVTEDHLEDGLSDASLDLNNAHRTHEMISEASADEEEDQGLGTPLTLALIWEKKSVVRWLIDHKYTGLSWKIIFKTTLETISLGLLQQLSDLGIEVPKRRLRLFFEALAQYHSPSPTPPLEWLTSHGLDPLNVTGLLPKWEASAYHYDLEQSAPKEENLATWLFRHFHTRINQLHPGTLLELCQWLHYKNVDIFQSLDTNKEMPFIVQWASELDDHILLDWLKSIK